MAGLGGVESLGLCIGPLLFLASLAISAIILRLAVACYNKIAGGELSASGVTPPVLGWGMVIAFLHHVVSSVVLVGFVIMAYIVLVSHRPEQQRMAEAIALVVALPILYAVLAVLLAILLPTTLGRALGIAFFYYLIVVVIGLALSFTAAALIIGTGLAARP